MILGLTVLILVSVYLILRSRRGIALIAIRDNELASESLGINITRSKLFVYIITSGLTTILGALIFLQKLRISPDAAFNVNDWTAFVIFIVVIGGIGTIEGPIIGVLVFFLLRETLADLGTIYLIMLGCVAIAVMIKAPKGVWGFVSSTFKIELFPLSRKLKNK
jgi:branched-chain amino acid transport system permease protein